jgi:hypothetical protein
MSQAEGFGLQDTGSREKSDMHATPESTVTSTVGSAKESKNHRQLAARLGLAPTQHSIGGHTPPED